MGVLFLTLHNVDNEDNNFGTLSKRQKEILTITKVYHGSNKANNALLQFVDRAKNKIDSCINSTAPSVIIEVNSIKEKRIAAVKEKGLKLRYVTEITEDNINYIKEMLTFSEIRHHDGMKGNFEVADQREYVAVATLHKAQEIPQLIFSNLPEIVEQQQFVFDSFWNRAVPAEQKIKEIEEGIVSPITVIYSDYKEAEKKEWEMLRKAKKRDTDNVFYSKCISYAGKKWNTTTIKREGRAKR
jgi:hypothetical protein